MEKLMELARKALYRIDGPIASDDGMIIENALTMWEQEREQLSGTIDGLMQTLEDKSPYAATKYWEWLLGEGKTQLEQQNKRMKGALASISKTYSDDFYIVALVRNTLQSIQGGSDNDL